MPFVKRGNFYYSPSGRRYTKRQVKAYYATKGFSRRPRRSRKPKK